MKKTICTNCTPTGGYQLMKTGDPMCLGQQCSNGHFHPMLNFPTTVPDRDKFWDHFRQEFVTYNILNSPQTKKNIVSRIPKKYDFTDEYLCGGISGANAYGTVGAGTR